MRVKLKHVVATGLVLLSFYAANFFYASYTGGNGGTFGDSFGAVNALFSGSALFFLVLAFLSQREELQLIREERDDTRDLLKGQGAITKLQEQALNKQVFELTFFRLVELTCAELTNLNQRPAVNVFSTAEDARDIAASIILSKQKYDRPNGTVGKYHQATHFLVTAFRLLREYDCDRESLAVYLSGLGALVDERFLFVLCILLPIYGKDDPINDPIHAEVFENLQLISRLPREHASAYDQSWLLRVDQ